MDQLQTMKKDRWSAPLFIAVALGFCIICGYVLLDVRRADWAAARLNTSNLVTALEQDIVRNIDLYIYALRGASEKVSAPEVAALDDRVRRIVLFDRGTAARYVGDMMVVNEHGYVVESQSPEAGRFNHADRDYFLAHQKDPYRGSFVSRLNVDHLGQNVLAISRRLDHSDGSFAGIVVCMMRLQYIADLFGKLTLSPNSAVSLVHTDGTVLGRVPSLNDEVGRNVRDSGLFQHFKIVPEGSYESRSLIDGITRVFAYTQVGDYPLILLAGVSTEELEASWLREVALVGGMAFMLFVVTIVLLMRLRAAGFRRSALEKELASIAQTDALTQLPNRRAFDAALLSEWRRAERNGEHLALLMLDADRFKPYNDRFGHQAGDELLAKLGGALASCARRGGDVAARYGGEEFVMLLPSASAEMIRTVAANVRRAVADLAVPHPDTPSKFASFSIGAACIQPRRGDTPTALLQAADRAMYQAKEGGRDRVVFDPSALSLIAVGRPADAVRDKQAAIALRTGVKG